MVIYGAEERYKVTLLHKKAYFHLCSTYKIHVIDGYVTVLCTLYIENIMYNMLAGLSFSTIIIGVGFLFRITSNHKVIFL